MNSRINIRSSSSSMVISRGTLESLVHVGWTTGINGFAGFGFGFGFSFCFSVVFDVEASEDLASLFDSAAAAAFARLRSCP